MQSLRVSEARVSNPPRKKGTGAETELKSKLVAEGIDVRRTSAGMKYDLVRTGQPNEEPIEILATRPDNGRWLMTIDLDDFMWMVNFLSPETPLQIEVKRYKRFSLHRIFEEKFGT